MGLLARLSLAAGLASLFAVGCSSGDNSAGGNSSDQRKDPRQAANAVHFVAEDRWYTAKAELEDGTPVAWIANVPFASEDTGRSFPDATIADLPRGAIVMVAVGPRQYAGDANFERLDLPLEVSSGHVLTEAYEGQPAAHVSYFFVDRLVGDAVLNVWGYIGESPPGAASEAEANQMLAALRVPTGSAQSSRLDLPARTA